MIRRVSLPYLTLAVLLLASVLWMLTHRDMLNLNSITEVLHALGI
jgi:hypothetical protein